MESSQGSRSSTTTTLAGLVENASSIQRDETCVDGIPIYVKELIAGGFAGALSKTTVAPLERVKILWQTRIAGFHTLGVYQSLNKLVKHEGVVGLYKGNGASVIRIIPYAALHFMTYERYKSWILNNYPMLGTGPFIDLLAGSAAGGTSVLCTYPLDLARTKLAYQVTDIRSIENGMKGVHSRPAHSGIKSVLTSVYKEGGFRGLYRGAGPTLTGILPYAGLKFYMYEKLKLHVPEEHQKSILMRLSCGALAGLFGQTLTYPLDVVKRQMQVGSLQNASHENVVYRNTLDGLRTIVRNQGWRQLFAGVSINYIRIVPSAAISFTTYDMMKAWLGVTPQQKSRPVSAA
ncbi:PREDICTED: mitochondrial substrate carrier family protein P [Lupinus angustifolius]|uniref:mitochondrial substrate carrier family protein P n=1 Tax=Lupinus angustifolius TaxID=3871 RepID=UPI00092E2990|nr:PREDICTED: mitochondrial substrate carrier family protein P [Lupinus angustifolius]